MIAWAVWGVDELGLDGGYWRPVMTNGEKVAESTAREFFHAKKRKSGGDIDWHARKAAWVASVEALFETIRQFLAAPVKAGDLTISRSPKTVVEEYVGRYEIDELVLQVGNERAVFSPKGINVVGASGRVDLIGERGERTLVIRPGNRWGIVVSRSPVVKVIPFDRVSLLESLKDVMRP
jgi:hypothetical protein